MSQFYFPKVFYIRHFLQLNGLHNTNKTQKNSLMVILSEKLKKNYKVYEREDETHSFTVKNLAFYHKIKIIFSINHPNIMKN